MRARILLTLAGLIPAATTTAQVSLHDLPQLARARAERLRPKQIAALEPFWPDLSLEYRNNQEYLDGVIAKVARLGDSVVPLLLEKLQPAQGGGDARNLAGNSRRVLERLDPASFVDALAELARGDHGVARTEAIRLLGHANVPQSVRVLASLIGRVDGDDHREVVRSLRLLRARSVAATVAPLLGSTDARLREEVLAYLTAARADDVADLAVQAMQAESSDRLLSAYIDYFGASVRGHEGATNALLPLLNRERIDWQDTWKLIRALADVAPEGHEPTIRRLHEFLDANESGSLAVRAAVTLRDLGDRQGVTRLKRSLDDKLRRRKREAALYEQRASLLFAIGDYGDAIDDYEKILDYSEGAAMTRRAYVGMLKCEARRDRIQSLVKLLKSANMSLEEIAELQREDEPFRVACEHDRVQNYLKQLQKDQAPK